MRWKMKKKVIALCILVYSLLWGISSDCKAADPINSELIILIDTSKSIDGAWQEVKQWANRIGVNIQDTGIVVSVKGFGGRDEPVQNIYRDVVKSGDDALENGFLEYTNQIQKLHADNEYTDQLGIMQSAINIMEESNAEKKCIIMLSDGYLDYKKKEGEDEEAVECKAKEDFKDLTESFVTKENQNILLVQFESSYKVGKYIFENLEGVQVLYSNADQEKSDEYAELLDKALKLVFEDLGVDIKRNTLNIKDNKTEFLLEKDYRRTIIEIESLSGSITKDILESVQISRKEDNKEIKPDFYSILGNLGFVYLENSKKGTYTVRLPQGNWVCSKTVMEEIGIQGIELSIVRADGSDVQSMDGEYILNRDEKYKLKIDVQTQTIDQQHNLNNAEIACVLTSEGEKKEGGGNAEKFRDGVYHYSLDFMDAEETTYLCYVEIQYAGELADKSEEIKIKIGDDSDSSELEESDPILKDLKINEKVNISKEPDILTENYILRINDEETDAKGDNENSIYKYKDGCLSFRKAGEYDVYVDIKDEGKEKRVKYHYTVTDDRNWFQKFVDWLLGR